MTSRRLAYLKALEIDVWERRELSRSVSSRSAHEISSRSSHGVPGRSSHGIPLRSPQEPAVERFSGMERGQTETSRGGSPSSAVAALDWAALEATVRSCALCPLHSTRTQAVFGVGDRNARWMVIGEAPGMDEDRQGEPFVGRAGQLLNSMLKAIGLEREQVFIANILKSRPPNNRDPRPEEVRACIPYLFRQIELVNPRLILCVGRIAAQTLLDSTTPIGKLRGTLHRIAANRPMIVTYHPAYLLRSPGEKRKTWADLVLAMRTFERLSDGTLK